MSKKRVALREKLIESAENQMKINGLTGLRARDITKDAGCALGGLYTAFGDLDDLVLHINARTLDRLSETLAATAGDLAPKDALLAIALEYAHFAEANRPLWDALFDHKSVKDDPTPDWFKDHQRAVMSHVVTPLHALQPGLSEADLHLRARTYFSSIHGIVSISLQGRFVGLPGDHLDDEISRFVGYILAGSLESDSSVSPT